MKTEETVIKTKVVTEHIIKYYCDICGKEVNYDSSLKKCEICERDMCRDCEKSIDIGYCRECAKIGVPYRKLIDEKYNEIRRMQLELEDFKKQNSKEWKEEVMKILAEKEKKDD